MSAITPEDSEQLKELYAHFGAAMSCAADLEVGLIHGLLALEFLTGYAEKIQREGMRSFNRSTYEREFDKFFADHQKLPMGELIKRFERFAASETNLIGQLRDALKTRNFLAHHFFREHAAAILNRSGRASMIEELRGAQDAMQDVLHLVEAFLEPVRKRLRFDEMALCAHVDACIRAAEAGEPLPEFEVRTAAVGRPD
jgi:hypothetical protein